jgi:leucyl aminopeptidase
VFESELSSPRLTTLNTIFGGYLKSAVADSGFKGKETDQLTLYSLGKMSASQVVLIGLGKKSKFDTDGLRKAAGEIAKKAKALKHVAWILEAGPKGLALEGIASAVAEGFVMGSYRFDRYKKGDKDKGRGDVSLTLCVTDPSDLNGLEVMVKRGQLLGESTNLARDLANTPPNDMMPDHFVKVAKGLFKKTSVEIEIIDQKKAAHYGMGAFLGVAQGSKSDAYILIIRHRPKKGAAPIVLVGKGVTFDSGGISIKPGKAMSDMKADMSGAAAVLSAMNVIVKLGADINVTAIMPLTENMPSGGALRPGDVVTAMNGKTIEIINTDAEGRLILGDALAYAVREENAAKIVDIATLTGACSVAIGDLAAGVLGNHQSLIDELIKVGRETGEWLWQLPLFDGYLDYLKSDTADIANASEAGKAGTCTGAKFLEQFVGSTHWAHLDIASVMKCPNTKGYMVKGMSGAGARLLAEWVMAQAAKVS